MSPYSGSKLYREEQDETLRGKYRTECWLERCIFEERLCPQEDHVTFLPLSISTPVPGSSFVGVLLLTHSDNSPAGAENITLSFSGLDQSEACWITRLLRALGTVYATLLT
jgi:DNA replication regulator DPB11